MTFNTGNPIGSTDARDLSDNAENFDTALGTTAATWVDRFGVTRDSFEGRLAKGSFYRVGDFATGYTLTNMRQTLEYSGHEYSWAGTFPKVVAAGATPATSGGIGAGAWVDRTDLTYRQEADKKFKYSVKLSDYETLQDAADDAIDSILIDIDYNFTSNETVDFFSKVLTIDCKASFICDGSLIFTNLGEGSKIINPSLKSYSTPYVIYRFDDNGDWLDSASVLAGLSQSRTQGYQPTINDTDIWDSLTTEIQNQNISCELILGTGCSGIDIIRPTGEFALIRSILNNNVTIFEPNFLGGKGAFGSITFANYDSTEWGYGNRVVGGRVAYGSFSSVAFLRNKGYEGGVFNFTSYRCGESGVKTFQNEVGGRSARCYKLSFENIKTKQCFYDGIDGNADYGTVVSRVDDYSVAEYPSQRLPTKHRFRNITTEGCAGVGAWWDGQGIYAENITTIASKKTGIWDVGTNNIIINATVIGCNEDNGFYNHLTCEGATQIIGASVTIYSGIQGYAIYAPNGEASNVFTNKDLTSGVILLTAINNSRMGNSEISSNTDTARLNLRPYSYSTTNDGVQFKAISQINTPSNESCRFELKAVQNGAFPKTLSINYGGTSQAILPVGDNILGDSVLSENGTIAFYFESGALKAIARDPSGRITRYSL